MLSLSNLKHISLGGIAATVTWFITEIGIYDKFLPAMVGSVNTSAASALVIGVLTALVVGIQQYETATSGDTNPPTTSPAVVSWPALIALEGTTNTAPIGTILATAVNPTSGKTWYAVVGTGGAVTCTNINPATAPRA